MEKQKKKIYAGEYLMVSAEKGLELHEELVEANLVNVEDEVAIMTLYNSCASRIRDVKYKHKSWYADKNCEYANAEDFVWAILTKKEDFWHDWLKQNEIYENSNWNGNLRPTIDRIDNTGNYSLKNIQVLSFVENVKKDSVFLLKKPL